MKKLIFIAIWFLLIITFLAMSVWAQVYDNRYAIPIPWPEDNDIYAGMGITITKLKTVWPSERLQKECDARYIKEKKEFEDCLKRRKDTIDDMTVWINCTEPLKDFCARLTFIFNFDNETKKYDIGFREDGVVMWRNIR